MIRVQNLHKTFGDQIVFQDVSFHLDEPCLAYIMGKSGCGKSVMLRILSSKMQPTSGSFFLSKEPVLVFQQPILIDSLTVAENMEIVNPRPLDKLDYERVRLDKRIENSYPNDLSFGQRKKLLILRALLKEPQMIFFDEPTTGLDRHTAKDLSSLFLDIHQNEDISMLVVSHDIYCGLAYSKEIIFLHDRGILFSGSPEEIRKERHEIIQEFLCSQ